MSDFDDKTSNALAQAATMNIADLAKVYQSTVDKALEADGVLIFRHYNNMAKAFNMIGWARCESWDSYKENAAPGSVMRAGDGSVPRGAPEAVDPD